MSSNSERGGKETTTGKGSSWGSLARPRPDTSSEHGSKKRKGPPPREYPPVPFSLRKAPGVSGRNTYECMQKLEVLKYSRQLCSDGEPVGRRGAAKMFGVDKRCILYWQQQEKELIAFSKKESATKQRTLHRGRAAGTEDVEQAIVDEINTLRKSGGAVTRDIVMAKLLSEKPTFGGGLPAATEPYKMSQFRERFNSWYYRFLKRHRFSIRRKTSVGQKKPDGWEGKVWAFIQKLRVMLRQHAEEAVLLARAAEATKGGGTAVEIEIESSPVNAEELRAVQSKIFALLYNMDQMPIQAEMLQETTAVERAGAKSAPIATGGKEKLRCTVVLTVRGDGEKVRPRIIYRGTPFAGETTKKGKQKKSGQNSLSHEHLPAQRTTYGYPAGGISLGVQKSSWCEGVQSNEWVTQDFMRRPDSTPKDQKASILVLDDFRCHRDEAFQKKLQETANTVMLLLGGGLTPVCQPLDRNINKEFKRGIRARYAIWVRDNFAGGKKKVEAPSRGLVATWVKGVWEGISAEVIRKCFKVCGLTLNLDGSEDHAWCIHTFGANYREVLREQRTEWEQAHGVELEPLQLPVIPTGDGAGPEVNTVSEAAKELEASLQPKTPDYDSDVEIDMSGDDISKDIVELEDEDVEGDDDEEGDEGDEC